MHSMGNMWELTDGSSSRESGTKRLCTWRPPAAGPYEYELYLRHIGNPYEYRRAAPEDGQETLRRIPPPVLFTTRVTFDVL